MPGKLVKSDCWVSVRVFLDSSSVRVGRLRTGAAPHNALAPSGLLELNTWSLQEVRIHSVLISWNIHLCPCLSVFLLLKPWDRTELHHQLSWFSSLQMADWGISRPPSIIALTNAHNKSPLYLLLSLYPIGFLFFWRTLTDTGCCQ